MPRRRTLLKTAALLAAAPASLFTTSSTALPVSGGSLISKAIPSSGERIPVVGIGANRYSYDQNPETIAPLLETLGKFAELGGGVIDTAPSYGSSEIALGNIIEQLGVGNRFFIATKCDQSRELDTIKQIATSTNRLKSGKLDLVCVHSLTNWQQSLPILREQKAAGRARYIGITTSRNSQFNEVADILESEPLDFVQLNYSLAERNAEQRLLKVAAEKGVAVMANLPFARGRLFSAVKGHTVPEWAADFDATSWARLFLKYIVSHPAVTCAIPGTTKLHHLVDNMGAAMGKMPNAEQRARIESYFASL